MEAEKEGKEEEEEKGRRRQVKARHYQNPKNLDGSQKAATRFDRSQRRGARTLVHPALHSLRLTCDVLTHGLVHQVDTARSRFVGWGEGGMKESNICASLHCSLTLTLSQSASESVSL